MAQIIFNTRDQLVSIDTTQIAVVQADGNYSRILFINKREISLSYGISKMEEILKSHSGKREGFVRLGRSIIVNHAYLYKIDLLRKQLVLTSKDGREVRLNLSKKLLKPYKEAIVKSIKIEQNYEENNSGDTGKSAI